MSLFGKKEKEEIARLTAGRNAIREPHTGRHQS